ncbi:MAG: NapC/NirT family cytochrome c [Methanosarcinales archaeon]|nr:NapC/NirT family cytochrome c [Methanosarcinales archaeon]
MVDMRKLIVTIIMLVFVLVAVVVFIDASNYVRDNHFCMVCHEKEYDSYNNPGDSLDYAHSHYEVSCAGCHEGHDHVAYTALLTKMMVLDVLGTHPPESKEDTELENIERCLVCHENYKILLADRLLDPHANVSDCGACHSSHTRGMSEETCASCHPVPFRSLEEEGGKHSKKGCEFCHPSHGYIMECVQCHGVFHQGVFVDCKECHSDAHRPADIEFTDVAIERSLCIKCHYNVNVTFNVQPSKHSNLDCIMCHPSHGQKQQCSKCHRPHGEESTQADCFSCHKGHTPRDVKYSGSTPATLCLECHEQTGNKLLDSNTRHAQMECVKCHPNHAQVPSCMDCHGTPHTSTTTDCERCHISAHELWIKD